MIHEHVIPVQPMQDEFMILPEVESIDALLKSSVSCRFQMLPGSSAGIAKYFSPGSSSTEGELPAPGWWDDRPSLGPVSIFRIIGAYYFPYFGVLVPDRGGALSITVREALYTTPDLLKLPFTFSQAGEAWFRVPSDLETIGTCAITMPYGSLHNYGHFMLDCLPSIAALREARVPSRYQFVFPELTAWQRRHLELLDVEVSLKPIPEVVHVNDAIYTSCMHSFLHSPNTLYQNVRYLQLANIPIDNQHARRKKIYLSRSVNRKRVFLSELELQSQLETMGFEILSPETMSVDDQILLFRDAEIIVGHTGAAFANVLYCAPGTLVIETQPDHMQNLWVRKLCALMGCRHAAYFSPSKTLCAEHPESGLEFDFNVNRFISYVSRMTEMKNEAKPQVAPELAVQASYPTYLRRSDVLNYILTLSDNPRYLEIGVSSGETFFAIKADTKVAVDPKFLFDIDHAKVEQENALFHAVESDVYFAETPAAERFDVIFIDGLHTFEQTLRDFCNAIEFLKDDGVIVIDDVLPNSYHASLPDLAVSLRLRTVVASTDLSWMGDVYRLVFFIETFFQQYRYATVIENQGLLVVWKQRRKSKSMAHRTVGEIGQLPYECTIIESDIYNRRPFREIMSLLRGRVRS